MDAFTQKANKVILLMALEFEKMKPNEKCIRSWLNFEDDLLACKFALEEAQAIEKYRRLDCLSGSDSEIIERIYSDCYRSIVNNLMTLFRVNRVFPSGFSKKLRAKIDDFLEENRFIQMGEVGEYMGESK